jgi:hypothetical protein
MKVIMYSRFPGKSPNLYIDLIPMGLECMEVKTGDDLINALKNDPAISIILTENYEIEFLKQIREINKDISIFLMMKNTMKPEQIKALSSLGISAIIYLSEDTGSIAEEIVRCIVSQNIQRKDKRTHFRVKPGAKDNLKCAISIKNLNRYIQGSIIDISAGGCAVSLDNRSDISYLTPKMVYDPLIVIINNEGVKTLATLVAIRKSFAGFKFDNVEPAGMKLIATYIYKRMVETSGIK